MKEILGPPGSVSAVVKIEKLARAALVRLPAPANKITPRVPTDVGCRVNTSEKQAHTQQLPQIPYQKYRQGMGKGH